MADALSNNGSTPTQGPSPPNGSDQSPKPPKEKKRRITLACTRCRQKKGRCDGVQPTCGLCAAAGVECEVPNPEEDGRKRKRRDKTAPLAGSTPTASTSGSGGTPTAGLLSHGASALRSSGGGAGAADSVSPGPWSASQHGAAQSPTSPHGGGAGAAGVGTPSGSTAVGNGNRFVAPQPPAIHRSASAISMPPPPLSVYSPDLFSLPGSNPYINGDARSPQSPFGGALAGPSSMATATSNTGQHHLSMNHPPPPSMGVDPSQMLHNEGLMSLGAAAAEVSEQQMGAGRRGSEANLKLQYFRPFGPTAIQPGLEQINISIAAANPSGFSRAVSPVYESPPAFSNIFNSFSDPNNFSSFNRHQSDLSSFPMFPSYPSAPPGADSTGGSTTRFYDDGSDVPRSEILDHLYPIFFERMASNFPFLSLSYLRELDRAERVDGPLLINAVCALAARFTESHLIRPVDVARSPATYGIPFADKAKSLLIPLLGYPSEATVGALLLLAYHEFGLNSEGALWMFAGMCTRMATDLGLHLDIRRRNFAPKQRASLILLWWSCVVLDRLLALGTGRVVTIKETEISAPAPTDEDIWLVASDGANTTPSRLPPSPFPYFVRMVRLYGALSDTVNNITSSWATPAQSEPPSRDGGEQQQPPQQQPSQSNESLYAIENSITQVYSELPAELAWSPPNFRLQSSHGAGAAYLHLHLWYHCVLILLYRPPLIHPRTNSADLSLADRLAVVHNSCGLIGQILSCSDIIDDGNTYLASPFVNQCFFVAAMAWIQDYRLRVGRNILASGNSNGTPLGTSTFANGNAASDASGSGTQTHNSSTNILAQVALTNFGLLKTALTKQTKYWLGVGWIGAILEKAGVMRTRSSIKAATEGINTLVSGNEMAIFRRLAQRISGGVRTPDMDGDAMTALFSLLQQQDNQVTAHNLNLTPDDFALAYTFASSFPEG